MDFRRRYLGTLLGSCWALFSPLMTILLIYFVMTYGLKVSNSGDTPFIDWLIAGMLAWLYCLETISSGVMAITESSHLVTKIRFPLWILPLVKILSPLAIHAILMLVFLVYLAFTSDFSITWVQVFYYMFCAMMLCLGIVYITSAAMVFVRDVGNFIGILMQIMFWATPIFWNSSMLAGSSFRIILYNPFNYVVSGYRMCLFDSIWFWERPLALVIFWGMVIILLGAGIFIFNQTKKYFADVF